ncbi:MAG: glycosyltransferase [Acidimicrobiia bacterium]
MSMRLLTWYNDFLIGYFVVVNAFYLMLSVLAYRSLRRYVRRLKSLHVRDLLTSAGGLPISLIVPAFNERATIVDSIRSLLTLDYPSYEILIVNDGSTDGTLEDLIGAFDLERSERVATSSVATAAVKAVYRSREHPGLWVVDKENGGKADALNACLNHTRTPLFCAMDADTLLEPDSLMRVVRPFLEDGRTVAAGGIVRVANGCVVEAGLVREVRLPRNLLARFQTLEYLRAFLAARVGWDELGATMIISGAFGAFRREIVAGAGGFSTDTVGEDMELVVRLHAYCRDNRIPYRVSFVPDPVAWTEAPESLAPLGRQRDRWQRGLAEVIVRHRRLFARPRYGPVATVALPFSVVFELLGPVIELIGYATILVAAMAGAISTTQLVAFLALALFFGSGFSIAAVALEELSFRRYQRSGDLGRLLLIALVESFGYRQLTLIWRLQGLWSAARGKTSWGAMERVGFDGAAPSESPAEPRRAA